MSLSRSKASLHRSRVTRYRKNCALELGGRILDCGGGLGAYLPYLRGDVTVLDIDPQVLGALNHCKKVLGDCEALPFSDDSFDNVWACAVAQYLRLDVFVREAIRVTKSEGHVLILVPNGRSPWDRVKRLLKMKTWWDQKGIVRQYTVDDLRTHGHVTGEIRFLPLEFLLRHVPALGHTLMLEVQVQKSAT